MAETIVEGYHERLLRLEGEVAYLKEEYINQQKELIELARRISHIAAKVEES